jgi:hypothetical protein
LWATARGALGEHAFVECAGWILPVWHMRWLHMYPLSALSLGRWAPAGAVGGATCASAGH